MISAAAPSVLFVGESPPPEAPANFRPFDCASGTRLARSMLGLTDRAVLIEHVPMVNLFDRPTGPKGTPAWQPETAMSSAEAIFQAWGPRFRALVLLGSRVAAAFGCESLPGPVSVGSIPTVSGDVVVVRAPHPSGASTALNSPEVVREVRRVLLPELIIGCPTLRPWHFRLDDPAVLEDLTLALSPLRPSAGLVAIEWAAAQHKRRLASPPGSLLARLAGSPWSAGPAPVEDVQRTADTPPWDESLMCTALSLLAGARGIEDLSARWDEGGGPKPTVRGRKTWLSQRIAAMDDGKRRAIDALASTAEARAMVLRYMLTDVHERPTGAAHAHANATRKAMLP